MQHICESHDLDCPRTGRTTMTIAVNFGGELKPFCCPKCADDCIRECSGGRDSLAKAELDGDVFCVNSTWYQNMRDYIDGVIQEIDHSDGHDWDNVDY